MADQLPENIEADGYANPVTVNLPRRNPSLIQRIAARIVKADPAMGPQPTGLQTTQTGESNPDGDYRSTIVGIAGADQDRMAIYRDAEEMDNSSEEVSTALDTIADNLTTSEDGSQDCIEFHSDDSRVQQVGDQIVAIMRKRLKGIGRTAVKYGDFFGEIVVNGAGQVTDVVPLPPRSMHRHEDEFGRLKTTAPTRNQETGKWDGNAEDYAFVQKHIETDEVIAAFWPWQILHIRLGFDGLSKYGKGQFRVTRLVWRQLKALIEALVIGRLTRDFMKLAWYVDTTGLSPKQKKQVMAEFKSSVSMSATVSTKRENPFSVLTDFYLSDGYVRSGGQSYPMRTRVEAIDPKNSGQHNITDIQFIHDKLMMTLRVPKEHIYSSSIQAQPGILTQKDVQYVRWLRSVQRDLSIGLDQLVSLALILQGIDPTDVEWEICWPALRATDEAAAAQTELARAQADQIYLQEGVVSPTYIMKSRFGLDDEQIAEIQEENEQLAQQEFEQQQQLADQQHQNTMEQLQAKGAQQDSVHRDVDGKRKGDEGRTRDGKRIAPTKSKRRPDGSPTPSGSKAKRSVKAAGVLDEANSLLLERLRPYCRIEKLAA